MTADWKPSRAIAFAAAALLLAIATPACAEEKDELQQLIEALCGRPGDGDEAGHKACVTNLLASALKDETIAGIHALCEHRAGGDGAEEKACVTNQIASAVYVKTWLPGDGDEAGQRDCVINLLVLASALKDETIAGIHALCEHRAGGDGAEEKACVTNQIASAVYVKTWLNKKIEPDWDRGNLEITARCEARFAPEYSPVVLSCMVEGLRELNARLAAERGN